MNKKSQEHLKKLRKSGMKAIIQIEEDITMKAGTTF